MKIYLSVLFTFVLSGISSSVFAHDVRYKNQYLNEDTLRESLKTHFNVDMSALGIGGGTLKVTLPGKIYGLREVACDLLPVENGRKHMAVNCRNDFGGSEAKRLEGKTFDVYSDGHGGLIFSEYTIYFEARRFLEVRRIKNAHIIQNSKPIVQINAEGVEPFECSLDVIEDAVNFDFCIPKHEATEYLSGKTIPPLIDLVPVLGK